MPRLPHFVSLCLAVSVALSLFLRGGFWPVPSAEAAGLDVAAAEAQFLDLLNADRAANGLQPVQADPRLMEIARWRSEDLLARNYLSHDIGGFTISRVLQDRQVGYSVVGETLVLNTFDEARTVTMAESGLMNSPAHRSVILRPSFNLVGVGIAAGPNQRVVYTQIFVQSYVRVD